MANACGFSSWRQDVRAAAASGLILLVTACATSGPPPVQYVLGTDQAPPRAVNPVRGRQVVEVRPVRLPEYLDTRDLLVRKLASSKVVEIRSDAWCGMVV